MKVKLLMIAALVSTCVSMPAAARDSEYKIPLADVLAMPEVREKLAAIGLDAVGNTPAQFAAIVRNDHQKWGKVIRDANIKLD